MKMELRLTGSFLAIALGLLALPTIAHAQTTGEKPRLPQQVIPTGEEDVVAPQAARASAAARSSEQALEQKLLEMTSESSDGLVQVKHPDGSVTVNLEGRFMSVLVATPSEDGGTAVSCHTGENAVEKTHHAQDVTTGKAPKVTASRKHAHQHAVPSTTVASEVSTADESLPARPIAEEK